MSQAMPPPGSYPPPGFQPAPAPKTNGLAIASLICGILFCVPYLASLSAIILGILGIQKSKQPGTGGKGMAIAGLVLGVLGLLISVAGTAFILTAPKWGSAFIAQALREPVRQTGTRFVESLTSGDGQSASQHTTANFSTISLATLGAEMKSYGKFNSLSIGSISLDTKATDGKAHVLANGTISFESVTKNFSATLIGDSAAPGTFKIDDFKLQ